MYVWYAKGYTYIHLNIHLNMSNSNYNPQMEQHYLKGRFCLKNATYVTLSNPLPHSLSPAPILHVLMLPLATHVTYLLDVTPSNPCHTHYYLHSFHFVLFTFKDLVAKQHSTNAVTCVRRCDQPRTQAPPIQNKVFLQGRSWVRGQVGHVNMCSSLLQCQS